MDNGSKGSEREIDYTLGGTTSDHSNSTKEDVIIEDESWSGDAANDLPTSFTGRAIPRTARQQRWWRRQTVMGVGDELGAGDSYLVEGVLPGELAEVAFEKMREEVKWCTMYHRGGEVPRLVAVEGEVAEDGSFPVYRHPADESPPLSAWSPTVAMIREYVQQVLEHPVNHVLIQHYRSGKDYISEHSDKTIDVVQGSNIVNVSLGAQRVMTLRLKKDRKGGVNKDDAGGPTAVEGPPRPTQRIPLPHNSMFVMGPDTNRRWLHGINHDNRPFGVKNAAEKYNGGERISLTFRHIGTFLNREETLIWGQGAKGKRRKEAGEVVRGGEEAERLILAFGLENQKADFEWEDGYGGGFDVLHFTDAD